MTCPVALTGIDFWSGHRNSRKLEFPEPLP